MPDNSCSCWYGESDAAFSLGEAYGFLNQIAETMARTAVLFKLLVSEATALRTGAITYNAAINIKLD